MSDFNSIALADKAYHLLTENNNMRVCDLEDTMGLLLMAICQDIDGQAKDHATIPSVESVDKFLYIMQGQENALTRICARYAMYLCKIEETKAKQ